mgnify:CR=1 FL=1
MVPRAGLEPARLLGPRILSPVRLPISPPGHELIVMRLSEGKVMDYFSVA